MREKFIQICSDGENLYALTNSGWVFRHHPDYEPNSQWIALKGCISDMDDCLACAESKQGDCEQPECPNLKNNA